MSDATERWKVFCKENPKIPVHVFWQMEAEKLQAQVGAASLAAEIFQAGWEKKDKRIAELESQVYGVQSLIDWALKNGKALLPAQLQQALRSKSHE